MAFLWLGTSSGLYRFDGIHFERFQPPAGIGAVPTSVLTLLAPPTEDLDRIRLRRSQLSKRRHIDALLARAAAFGMRESLPLAGFDRLDLGGHQSRDQRLEHSHWTDQTDRVLHLPSEGYVAFDRSTGTFGFPPVTNSTTDRGTGAIRRPSCSPIPTLSMAIPPPSALRTTDLAPQIRSGPRVVSVNIH